MPSGTPRFILNDVYPCSRPEKVAESLAGTDIGSDPIFERLNALWQGIANSFVTGTGPHPGVARILLIKSDLDKIDRESRTHFLRIRLGEQNRKIAGLIFKSCVCVTPSIENHPNSHWLVVFHDGRGEVSEEITDYTETFANWADPGKPADWWRDSSNGATATTWQEMADDLWNLDGVSTLPFTPHGSPEAFSFAGVSGYEAMTAVLERIRAGVVPDLADGTFSMKRLGTDDGVLTIARNANKVDLRTRPRRLDSVRLRIPATVRVYFPVLYPKGLEKTTTADARGGGSPPMSHQHLTNGWAYKDVAAASAGVSAADAAKADAVTHPLWDDLRARFLDTYESDSGADGNAADNDAALTARATERATDFYRDLMTERFTDIYLGFPDFKPGPIVKMVGFYDLGDGIGGYTIVAGGPGYWAGETGAGEWSKRIDDARLNCRAPDWARYTAPDYPPTDQVLKMGNPTTTSLGFVSADIIRPDHVDANNGFGVAVARSALVKQDIETNDSDGTIENLAAIGRWVGHADSGGVKPVFVAGAERVALCKPSTGTANTTNPDYFAGTYKAVAGLAHWAIPGVTQTAGNCWIRASPRASPLSSTARPSSLPTRWRIGYFDGWVAIAGDSRPVLVVDQVETRRFPAQLRSVASFTSGSNWRGTYDWRKVRRTAAGFEWHPDGETGSAINRYELGNDTAETSGKVDLSNKPTDWEPKPCRTDADIGDPACIVDMTGTFVAGVEYFDFEKGTDLDGPCDEDVNDSYKLAAASGYSSGVWT